MIETYNRMMPESTVTLRRQGEPDCVARARVSDVRTDELVGGLDQTVRTVIVLANQVTFATRLKPGDEVVMPSGDVLRVEVCDADKRCVDGVLIAYELTVMG